MTRKLQSYHSLNIYQNNLVRKLTSPLADTIVDTEIPTVIIITAKYVVIL